jgi:DNA-binding response OmpR family regulator
MQMTTLLYVDDEEPIGRLISRYFSRRGDRVLLAHTVAEAQAVLEAEEPSAILVDVWLGLESGVELVNWLSEHRPHLVERVTFVTGERLDRYQVGLRGATVNCPVIHKPFVLTELASYIDDAGSRAGA